MLDPSLKGKPVAVGGDVENRHGIILAKNYEAKKYGVQTAEALWQAKQKCPNLIIVPPHYEEYLKYSRLAHAIYAEYTDLIEPYGMDEVWMDITGSTKLFGDGEKVANELRRRMKFELGLTISVGVSFCKVFAKFFFCASLPFCFDETNSLCICKIQHIDTVCSMNGYATPSGHKTDDFITRYWTTAF